MQIAVIGSTDVGRVREVNEDSYLTVPEFGLYVVCDGMGGHAAGDVASKLAAETVAQSIRAQASMLQEDPDAHQCEALAGLMRHAVEAASKAVFEHAQGADARGMGTTCTALLCRGSKAIMAHVGDSRLYLARSGQLHLCSQDHTYVAEAVRQGIMTWEEAAESGYGNIVTRAVGPQASVLVDTLIFDLLPGDTMLLCSDGLHGYFNDEFELVRLLQQDELEPIAQQLVDLANERGGDDNITAVTLRIAEAAAIPQELSGSFNRVSQDFHALRQLALLSDMSLPELARISHVLETVVYQPGDVIVEEEDENSTLCIIADGTVSVKKDGQTVAELRTGSHFGEMSMLNHAPTSASVIAERPTRVLKLPREAFFELISHDHGIGAKFLWRIAQALSRRLDDALPFLVGRDDPRRTMPMGGHMPSPFARRH